MSTNTLNLLTKVSYELMIPEMMIPEIDVPKGSVGIYDAIINVSISVKDVSPLSFMKSQLGEVSREKSRTLFTHRF